MDALLSDLHRFFTDMIGRTKGPMTFRFILQPVMAALVAWHDGRRDARKGDEPYFQRLRHDGPATRPRDWRKGVTAVTRVLLLAVGMDVIYQFKVFGGFKHPPETFVIAVVLAFIPYLVLRGPFERLMKRRMSRH